MSQGRTILVTHALPYANGPLHIGHLLGYIQCDIWVRARRMAGDTVHFVAADDVHGTPIMLAAEKAGKSPEEFIGEIYAGHVADFAAFGVQHDFYYTTHSAENRELAERIYETLRDDTPSHIATRAVRQFYDPVKQMFLPDRYIKGECPNCGTPDQYGDNCENCGATYAPTDLKNPYSVVSGAAPELRDSEHYFFKVGDFAGFLREWLGGGHTHGSAVAHPSVAAKLKEWLDSEGGVRDWDISRDAPYFGFEIPGTGGTKFFYVWLDAPIGYLASFKKYCASPQGAAHGLTAASFDRFMQAGNNPDFDPAAQMHHFIGKDIINFHGLFWPAMLKGAGLRTPDALHVNGYLTVNGEKMSKSRGTFIQARTYLDAGLNPDYLRYYFATMLSDAPVDVDLDLKAFEERVNSHLVGKWANIASRTAGFVQRQFAGKLADAGSFTAKEEDIYRQVLKHYAHVPGLYRDGNFAEVTRQFITAADFVNAYIAETQPWLLAKDESRSAELHHVCTFALSAFRVLTAWIKPLIPAAAGRAEAFLGLESKTFDDAKEPPWGHRVGAFEPLVTRVDAKRIDAMIEASKESMITATPSPPNPPVERKGSSTRALPEPLPEKGGAAAASPAPITIDDFARLDLRIGTVLQCEFVDGSDKLLRFELDAGDLGRRQIFSGIRAAYAEPTKLVGRKVVFIANLAPRKMRFGLSEGMILSAGSGADQLFLLDVDDGAQAGMPVK